MQDRYPGDLGDFLKFGLLRWLTPEAAPGPGLTVLGPPWMNGGYLHPVSLIEQGCWLTMANGV